jgi:hypothetical protein
VHVRERLKMSESERQVETVKEIVRVREKMKESERW